MLDQVTTAATVVDAIKEVDRRTIRNAVWRGALSCLGSAVQLEVRRAEAGERSENPEEAEAAKKGEIGFAKESDVDTSAYDSRVVAVQWVIANSGMPNDVVVEEAAGALKWLATRRDSDVKGADLDDLKELGLDSETIEAGRKLAARWDKERSQERSAIVQSIGGSVVADITSGVDQFDLEVGQLGLVVELLGKAVHSAMIGATARVEAASWSPRRKSEAISTLAGLVAVRDMLEGIDIPDVRDLITADREVW